MQPRDVQYLHECEAAIEATTYEQMCLFREYQSDWEESLRGFLETIKHVEIDGERMPICVCWSAVKIRGRMIALYETTSQVADSRLVEAYLRERIQGPITDAMNAHLAIPD